MLLFLKKSIININHYERVIRVL